jgi:hypothetical protein
VWRVPGKMERNNSLRNNGKIIKSNKLIPHHKARLLGQKKEDIFAKFVSIRKETILSVPCEVLFYVVDVSL